MKIQEFEGIIRESVSKVLKRSFERKKLNESLKKKEISTGVTKIIIPSLKETLTFIEGDKETMSGLSQLHPLLKKMEKIPEILRQYEWQITLKHLEDLLRITPEEKEKFKHLLTDPDNTNGIRLKISDDYKDPYVLADTRESTPPDENDPYSAGYGNKDKDFWNTITGEPDQHDFRDPNTMDSTEFGVSDGERMDPDYEDNRGFYDPDSVGSRPLTGKHVHKHDPFVQDPYEQNPYELDETSLDELEVPTEHDESIRIPPRIADKVDEAASQIVNEVSAVMAHLNGQSITYGDALEHLKDLAKNIAHGFLNPITGDLEDGDVIANEISDALTYSVKMLIHDEESKEAQMSINVAHSVGQEIEKLR